MKYLYIGVAILAVILAGCISTNVVLKMKTDAILTPLEQADTAAAEEDFASAVYYAKKAADEWNTHLRFFTSLLCHDETDEITEGFAVLSVVENAEFRQSCAELLVKLKHIVEMDQPLPHNILTAILQPMGKQPSAVPIAPYKPAAVGRY